MTSSNSSFTNVNLLQAGSQVTPIEESPLLPGCGSGRRVVLKEPMLLQDVIKLAKGYLSKSSSA